MALCETHFTILRILSSAAFSKRGKSLLQIGKAELLQ